MFLDLNTFLDWQGWNAALSVRERLQENTPMKNWFRKGSQEEDAMVTEANNVILDSLSNADRVNRIEALTGKDIRDQLTVEEAQELDKERKLRGFGVGRN